MIDVPRIYAVVQYALTATYDIILSAIILVRIYELGEYCIEAFRESTTSSRTYILSQCEEVAPILR